MGNNVDLILTLFFGAFLLFLIHRYFSGDRTQQRRLVGVLLLGKPIGTAATMPSFSGTLRNLKYETKLVAVIITCSNCGKQVALSTNISEFNIEEVSFAGCDQHIASRIVLNVGINTICPNCHDFIENSIVVKDNMKYDDD